jgi:hypothetical protein
MVVVDIEEQQAMTTDLLVDGIKAALARHQRS